MNLLEKFSPATKRAIIKTQEEAVFYRSPSMNTEHLVLALCADPVDESIFNVITLFDVSLESIRSRIIKALSSQSSANKTSGSETVGDQPKYDFSPLLKEVLQVASDESALTNSDDITPYHLLLGLLSLTDTVSQEVDSIGSPAGYLILRDLGLTYERVKAAAPSLTASTVKAVTVPVASSAPSADATKNKGLMGSPFDTITTQYVDAWFVQGHRGINMPTKEFGPYSSADAAERVGDALLKDYDDIVFVSHRRLVVKAKKPFGEWGVYRN